MRSGDCGVGMQTTGKLAGWMVGLALLGAGCNALPIASPSPTAPPPSQTPIPDTPTVTPVPLTHTPPPPTLTPTAVNPVCVPEGDPPPLAVGSPEGAVGPIREFLNAGGTPAALDAALYDAGIASQPVAVAAEDLTGDGKREVVVALVDPTVQAIAPPGRLLIYVCRSGAYELALDQESGDQRGSPHLWYVQDLDAEPGAEVVVSEPLCGAHTCYEFVRLLDWTGAGFENRLAGQTDDLPYPDVRVVDPDGDGVYDLEILGGAVGSVGAGPQRSLTRVWRHDSVTGRWEVAEERLAEADYRVHVLHDAGAAAEAGDYQEALRLYRQVIDDETLRDWAEPEAERATLSAYARFRIMVVYAVMGEADFAETAYRELRQAVPEGSAQRAYVEMAQAFLEAYRADRLEAGCAAARAYAESHAEAVLEPLGPAAFGYANPAYEPQDVCP